MTHLRQPRDDRNALDRYTQQRGHAPRFTTENDSRETVQVEYHRGYTSFTFWRTTDEPGDNRSHYTFYITRNAWVRILRQSLRLIRHQDRQFSVRAAQRRAYQFEKSLAEEQRVQKKQQRVARRRKLRGG